MNKIKNQKKEQHTEQKQEIQKKKKRKYETPKAIFEKYTPDQSISACYNIAWECKVGKMEYMLLQNIY